MASKIRKANTHGTIAANVRVLIDYRPALRDRTGVGEFVHQLVTALSAASLIGEQSPELLEITAFSASWKDRLQNSHGLPKNIQTVDRRIPVTLLNLAWHRLNWPPVELLTGRGYDVVHSPHPLLLPARSAATVITVHDLDFLDHGDRSSDEIRRDYPSLVKQHARTADQVVVPSHHTALEVERRLRISANMISVCSNGAPDWSPRSRLPSNGHLLFVGTLAPRKNISGLLDAYELLLSRQQDTPDLVMVGTKPDEAQWGPRLERSPLAGRVRCPGYVDRATLKSLYTDALVLVMPSLDEGFGLPILEAMTIGVPVVSSNRGALPEVLGEAGLLVDPIDPSNIAEAITQILTDKTLAMQCITRGIDQAQLFTWKASAQALCAAYQKAIAVREARR